MMNTHFEGRFLRMLSTEHGWEYCERRGNASAVMIFALTKDEHVILVEEYRPPVEAFTICFPAGLHGDQEEVESLSSTASRELFEEAGYEANELEFLFHGPSSPGLSSEMVSFFLATGLRRLNSGGGVDGEKITVHEIPLHDIRRWLCKQQILGKLIDPRVYTGLYFLQQHHNHP